MHNVTVQRSLNIRTSSSIPLFHSNRAYFWRFNVAGNSED